MRKPYIIWLIVAMCILSGCKTPSESQINAYAKVDEAQKAVDAIYKALGTNEVAKVNVAKVLAYAANYAAAKIPMTESNATQVLTTQEITARTTSVLGSPRASEAIEARKMVDGLNTTNEVGTNILAKLDTKVVANEKVEDKLNAKIPAAEAKVDDAEAGAKKVAMQNAEDAERWKTLMKWIRWTIFALIAAGFGWVLVNYGIPLALNIASGGASGGVSVGVRSLGSAWRAIHDRNNKAEALACVVAALDTHKAQIPQQVFDTMSRRMEDGDKAEIRKVRAELTAKNLQADYGG